MKALHDASYVHGDLRAPNMLNTKDGLKIIDSGLCEEVGIARYLAHISLIPDPGGMTGCVAGV